MDRSLVSTLPHPIANALQAFLDEDLPRSADELSELFVALVEYVGAVALADYLDGHADPNRCAQDASLNGWLVSQLATGKAEAGHWARWTQIAVLATTDPAIPCLRDHVEQANLDDATADLAWMLRFRNDVMHGGFVAPLPKIRQAVRRLEQIFERLAPLWALKPLGCTSADPESVWYQLCGLSTAPADAPTIERENWEGAGSVVLTNERGDAVLAIHPGCEVDPEGWMHLQHEWRKHHHNLFERPAIRAFFDRYQSERRGVIDASNWSEHVEEALPERGRVARETVETHLTEALSVPGQMVRLVGPEGSGRSTLAAHVGTLTGRTIYTLPVEDPSVRMDPGVVRRWVLQTLSQHFLETPAPDAATKSRPNSKEKKALAAWREALQAAASEKEPPILVVDDADRVGAGLYSGSETSGCLADARGFGAPVLLIHRPSQTPPASGDVEIVLAPWTEDELGAWGDAKALLATTGGHAELLAHPETGLAALQTRLQDALKPEAVGAESLTALVDGPATSIEVADRIDAFSPEVDLTLRRLLDHLIEGERKTADDGKERTYQLHPAAKLALAAEGGA